jgi:hypothetical protein
VFEELFADDFVDHTPQPGATPDKDGVRVLYKRRSPNGSLGPPTAEPSQAIVLYLTIANYDAGGATQISPRNYPGS